MAVADSSARRPRGGPGHRHLDPQRRRRARNLPGQRIRHLGRAPRRGPVCLADPFRTWERPQIADSGNFRAQVLGGARSRAWAPPDWVCSSRLRWSWPTSRLGASGAVLRPCRSRLGDRWPALNAVVLSLVRIHELASAMAVNNFPMAVSRAAGPAIGVFSATHLGVMWAALSLGSHDSLPRCVAALHTSPARPAMGGETDFSHRALVRLLNGDRYSSSSSALRQLGVGIEPAVTLARALGC